MCDGTSEKEQNHSYLQRASSTLSACPRESSKNANNISAKKTNDLEELKGEISIDEHKMSVDELCQRYETNLNIGLSTAKAEDLLKKYGLNALKPPKKTSEWLKFIKTLVSGFAILLLIGAAFSSIAFALQYSQNPATPLDNVWLAVVLVCVVVVTGCFQYYQESKSSKIMDSFKKMIPEHAIVLRDGKKSFLQAQNLVVGDIVFLENGQRVSADVRILKSDGLKVDNSSLTGESEPLLRSPDCTHKNPLETKNLAFFSTFIVEGSGIGLVIRTGEHTAMGRIASLATCLESEETHLAKELRHFMRIVTLVAISFGITFFIISVANGYSATTSFVFLIGVVIANVPEGLIACLTVTLALTAKRMAKKNCLVKKLESVESLGSIGIICSDKTGTLTMNRMTVSHMWLDNQIIRVNLSASKESTHEYENFGFENDDINSRDIDRFDAIKSETWQAILRCARLCNRAEFKPDVDNMTKEPFKRACNGDASETAILQYSEYICGNVMNYRAVNKKIFEIPFNSINKFQVSVHELDGFSDKRLLVMKGAPERILERCKFALINGEQLEIDETWKEKFNRSYETLGGQGERVLGFCDKVLDLNEYPLDYVFNSDNLEKFLYDLRFLGFISMIDPPKPNVPEAVAKCRHAGIRVFMVTGDHPITAKAIAKAVGIMTHETRDDMAARLKVQPELINQNDIKAIVISGSQLALMNKNELNEILVNYQEIIFARTSPQQKLIIVEGCQKLGVLVGVTGDGVNDSPAMKQADIGISMGITGSDVSKEVADMILLDDNFATIVSGIEEGRLIFDNIAKIIQYTFTKNMTQLTPFILYILMDIPLGLGTITILCVDIGTDVLPSLCLSYEYAESGIMDHPPRDPKRDKMTSKNLVSFCYGQIGLIEAAGGFFSYFVVLGQNGFLPSRLIGIRPYWDSEGINDLRDSYGAEWTYVQRKRLELACQAAFFVGIVICQLGNLLICRTKRESLFKHGFRNYQMFLAEIATFCFVCFLLYVPGLNTALGVYPLKFFWWLPAFPFLFYIVFYAEIIKWLSRKHSETWFKETFTF